MWRGIFACVTLLMLSTSWAWAQQSDEVDDLRERVELLEAQLEELGEGMPATTSRRLGNDLIGDSVSTENVGIWGYAEMHYNAKQGNTTKIDFHRFIVGLSKPINDWIYFNSEIEIEHAFIQDDQGAIELEQAYLDFQLTPGLAARSGIVLAPIGIINPRHEPNTFYGVERPDLQSAIIPSTWFDPAAGVVGRFDSLAFELYAMSPLRAQGFNSSKPLRGGRQKGYESETESLAITGMVRYTIPGLAVGGSFWRGNSISSDVHRCAAGGKENDTGVIEPLKDCKNTEAVDLKEVLVQVVALDVELQFGPFSLRSEYAQGSISNTEKLNQLYEKGVPSSFEGYYVEPAFRVFQSGDQTVGLFARVETITPQSKVAVGMPNKKDNYTYSLVGVNYWPHPDVVLKADIGSRKPEEGDSQSAYNLGIGWVY